MPHFSVILHGKGINVPSSNVGGKPIVGFFTSCNVTAADDASAVLAAVEVVRADWASGAYAEANHGSLPELVSEGTKRIGVVSKFFSRTPGYTFYTDDDSSAA